jgi:two-component system response regulator AtoC
MDMSRKNILVIDDEPSIRSFLAEVLRRMNYNVELVGSGEKALRRLQREKFDLLITDIRLPDISGMEILKAVKKLKNRPGVILVTAFATVENAVVAMKQGAYDYIKKPISASSFKVLVENYFKYKSMISEHAAMQAHKSYDYGFGELIVKNSKMKEILENIKVVAPTKATVLIQGASGTGKEVVAHAIHLASERRDKPFIKTNCAAIAETLVESEFFGHEKGAFTGADKNTKGRFELANGGTLLLDEISEMNPNLQAKLLRVLQEEEFEKVGNPSTVKVDVRIIATTNRNLVMEIEEGRFREDLYYRLNVVPLFLPPLKERKEEIIPLAQYFVKKYSAKNQKHVVSISESAAEILLRYDWPGNVRELENNIERAVIICPSKQIQPKHFPVLGSHIFPITKSSKEDLGTLSISELERRHILKVLRQQNWNRTRTAKILDISVRTLRNKLNDYRDQGMLEDEDEWH